MRNGASYRIVYQLFCCCLFQKFQEKWTMELQSDLSPCVDTTFSSKKERVKMVKNLPRLTRQRLPQTQVQVSTSDAKLWISLPHRQKRQAKKSPADGQYKQLNTERKNRTNNFLYPVMQHLTLSGHILYTAPESQKHQECSLLFEPVQ